jgi:hypothetical protein
MMNDNDIKKALECCINDDCEDCPLHGENAPDVYGNCVQNTKRNALDLINRQKAEIERLQNERIERIRELTEVVYDKEIAEAKSEAIKEFAERLENELGDAFLRENNCVTTIIDNLVKEMTEGSK